MKPIKITEHNIMFTEPMGSEYDLNLGLILGENRNYIIDTGRGSGSVGPILEYIIKVPQPKPTVVINTHSHWDHIWGNWVFKNSLIVSHKNCLKILEEHWDAAVTAHSDSIDGEVQKCLPNLVFEKNLCFADDKINIFYTPGHTSNCISVYDANDKILYAGDNIGDTDDSIVPWINTDIDTFNELIKCYKDIDFSLCISGHNKPQTKDVLFRMESELNEAWKKQNEKQ